MEKPLLTTHGVQEKTNSLYQLSDPELQVQADLILSDLIGWIADNFTTTPEQMSFLEGLSSDYIAILSEQAQRAVIHRWVILFIPNPPVKADAGVFVSKWIKSKGEDEAGEGGAKSNTDYTGRLIIETGY